ncbi:hypothetical protein E4V42_02040 [Clostridium estertheticum]|uniref:Uncharacterized protein n=1 Tax=Clostridium estertheticum TaxID=238834 RepID=A0A5N7IIY1_9CLOT|nr:hypothetical protein [Clostridium estertheticum]MPQ30221.1 hypothetical protein [Clostridium estertheticum]MPQ60897.1 hypothetical protein [Clostridium estertheticum]
MLLKLLKYEIKSSYGRFIVAFSVYIIIAAVLMTFFREYETVTTAALIFGMVALTVITFLTIFTRYNRNLYGNEGYLMFTLPIDGKVILASKLISAFIWTVVLGLIIVPSITILSLNYSDPSYIKNVYNYFEMNKLYTVTIGIEYLLNMFRSVLVIYFSISISKLHIWKKFSVLAGFGTYFIIELLSSIPTIIFKNVAMVSKTTRGLTVLVKDYSIHNILIGCSFDLLIFIVLFFLTAYLLDNKTSLK